MQCLMPHFVADDAEYLRFRECVEKASAYRDELQVVRGDACGESVVVGAANEDFWCHCSAQALATA
jgi:hypothetical protein